MNFEMKLALSAPQRESLRGAIEDWQSGDKVQRLWNRDASLWTNASEYQWLGWLDIVAEQEREIGRFSDIGIAARKFKDAVVLGMGGSSLCPEVLSQSFPRVSGSPALHILDSTVPAQVSALDRRLDLSKTLFIVSSKSGSTLEPNIFKQYFFERAGRNGKQFWTITDPGSKMEEAATRDGFDRIFHGRANIGGRYSALSDFGMVPAAAMGLDVFKIISSARAMADACSPWQPLERNPGFLLGASLGTLARAGRDKVTVICSPGIRDFGAWLEQLLAESTGKEGKGLIPVDREPLGPPANYGEDRVFIYVRTDRSPDPTQDRFLDSFEAAGAPVIRIPVANAYQLGAEFFRWEMATAVAGSIISINPFDQPDVEAAKIATRRLTTAFEERGSLPSESPSAEESGVQIFGAKPGANLEESLRTLLAGLRGGQFLMGQHRSAGYVALLAFIEMDPQYEVTLNSIRERIRDATRAATCLGFGPRYLHSTGQAYKGGPPNGTFIEITANDPADVPVPGQKYTFGIVKAAQAQGDLEVLRDRGHRTLRVHLGADIRGGLAQLAAAVNRALQ